jgi:hypothetical protein
MHTGTMASKAANCKTTDRQYVELMVRMSEMGICRGEVGMRTKLEDPTNSLSFPSVIVKLVDKLDKLVDGSFQK